MKKLLSLAFFGLIVQIAFAQVLEISSPTSVNLNTLINVAPKDGVGSPSIFIFGDGGVGYVSKDKAKSWQQLNIDPVKKRDINLATRVNDTLLFVSGGKENDLLKYSTDNGTTFKDFVLPEASKKIPVAAIIPMNNWEYSVVAFLQSNFFNLWQNYPGTGSGWVVQAGFSVKDLPFAYLGGSAEDGYVTTWGRTIRSGTSGDSPVFGIMMIHFKDPPLGYKFDLYPGQAVSDSITSVSPSCKGVNLTTFYTEDEYKDKDTQKGYHTFEGVLSPMVDIAFTNYRPFPELGKEMFIKSSLITKSNSRFWHVGGDINGKNGFIIKDGIIIRRVQSSGLNMLIDVSDSNNADAILAVGNNGKIYSTRTDLTLALPDAVTDLFKADNFSAYPNPFNSELTIKSSSEAIATLSDVLGTTLKQIRLESGDNFISLVGLKPGIYFLTNKKQTLKLIKQ
jgi:hypothetical protein